LLPPLPCAKWYFYFNPFKILPFFFAQKIIGNEGCDQNSLMKYIKLSSNDIFMFSLGRLYIKLLASANNKLNQAGIRLEPGIGIILKHKFLNR